MPERLVKYSLKRLTNKKNFKSLKKQEESEKTCGKGNISFRKGVYQCCELVARCPTVINHVVPPEVHAIY